MDGWKCKSETCRRADDGNPLGLAPGRPLVAAPEQFQSVVRWGSVRVGSGGKGSRGSSDRKCRQVRSFPVAEGMGGPALERQCVAHHVLSVLHSPCPCPSSTQARPTAIRAAFSEVLLAPDTVL